MALTPLACSSAVQKVRGPENEARRTFSSRLFLRNFVLCPERNKFLFGTFYSIAVPQELLASIAIAGMQISPAVR